MLDIFLHYLSLLHWLLDYAIALCKVVQLTSLAVTFFSRLPKRLGFLRHLTTETGSVGLSFRQMRQWSPWWMNDIVIHVEAPIRSISWVFLRCERIDISRILSCCFGILLECHEKAMVFAGDFNEDESGPIVRSLDLKPGDTAPWMECFFFQNQVSEQKTKFPKSFP